MDELIKELDGEKHTAELTGRKKRLITTDDGVIKLVNKKTKNSDEEENFMNGPKKIAIVSDASFVGISLHSDKRATNCTRRARLTIELPWSAEKTVQHRSNRASGPNYILLVTDVAGEMRFTSTVARRLQSLGAITQGDRSGAISSVASFAFYESYASEAMKHMLSALTLDNLAIIPPRNQVNRELFFKNVAFAFISVDFLTLHCSAGKVSIAKKTEVNFKTFLNRYVRT